MENPEYDWSTFEIKTPIKADSATIIKAWTSQEGLERWFLRIAEFKDVKGNLKVRNEIIVPGDTYRWTWYGWPDDTFETGKILEPKPGEFLRFIFGKAGIVSVAVHQDKEKSIVQLKQEKIPLDEKSRMNFYVGCKTGWTFYLLNLNSILQGGLDLRNKDQSLKMD